MSESDDSLSQTIASGIVGAVNGPRDVLGYSLIRQMVAGQINPDRLRKTLRVRFSEIEKGGDKLSLAVEASFLRGLHNDLFGASGGRLCSLRLRMRQKQKRAK